MKNPSRGEVWLVDLNPVRGHEQEGERRPCLIVSANGFNQGASGLVIVAPITKTPRSIPTHIHIGTTESGLDFDSMVQCDQIRSVSVDRLRNRIGNQLPGKVMMKIEDTLKILLNLR